MDKILTIAFYQSIFIMQSNKQQLMSKTLKIYAIYVVLYRYILVKTWNSNFLWLYKFCFCSSPMFWTFRSQLKALHIYEEKCLLCSDCHLCYKTHSKEAQTSGAQPTCTDSWKILYSISFRCCCWLHITAIATLLFLCKKLLCFFCHTNEKRGQRRFDILSPKMFPLTYGYAVIL